MCAGGSFHGGGWGGRQLLRVELATLFRYEPGRTATAVTTWGPAGENLPVGIRWPLEGHNITTLVFETGRPARTRRRIERDLHDGTQQQLVSLMLDLRAERAAVPPQLGELGSGLAHLAERVSGVFDQVREISHGIHPAILSERGLPAALKALARRSAVPVQLDLRTGRRLPGHVEVAAYCAVSEALANAAKHARASVVHVEFDTPDAVEGMAISRQ